MRSLAVVTGVMLVFLTVSARSVDAQDARPKPMMIDADAAWTAEVTVDREVHIRKGTLSVAPGVTVTFGKFGLVHVGRDGALYAEGTPTKPVRFVGRRCGQITTSGGELQVVRCEITGVGAKPYNRDIWLDVRGGVKPVVVRECRITGCSQTSISPGAALDLSGCDFRDCRGAVVVRGGKGQVLISGNTIDGADLTITGKGEGTQTIVRNNVIVGGRIYHARKDTIVVEGNYVHQPRAGNTYGLLRVNGTVRDNVLRGGSWVSSGLGGEITGNVFISLPHKAIVEAKGSFDKHCTHEHICGLRANARVTRNLFVGASYGAIMGIGPNTGTGAVVRHNTFDMHGAGNPYFFNHMPKNTPKDIRLSSNIFMRCSGLWDERAIADSASFIDYNLWSDAGKPRPYGGGGRFRKVTMTTKKPGDAGFGGHDVPSFGKDDVQPAPDKVVADPDVSFPFTDEEMLARKHTVAEVLKIYRDAYTPKADSPAVDAAEKTDEAVPDGKPDIGAVERAKR